MPGVPRSRSSPPVGGALARSHTGPPSGSEALQKRCRRRHKALTGGRRRETPPWPTTRRDGKTNSHTLSLTHSLTLAHTLSHSALTRTLSCSRADRRGGEGGVVLVLRAGLSRRLGRGSLGRPCSRLCGEGWGSGAGSREEAAP